jgi:hypothetical protein
VFHRFSEAPVLNWTMYVSIRIAPIRQNGDFRQYRSRRFIPDLILDETRGRPDYLFRKRYARDVSPTS